MKIRVLIISVFFVFSLLPGISLAQNKVVVIPMGADATGNATEADVLRGRTFSNQSGTGLTGTRALAPVPKMTAAGSGYGVPWPNPRFSGGIIYGYTDLLTGLTWVNPYSTYVNWNGAVTHCQDLVSGIPGHQRTDWRLPSLRELLSLIDYSQEFPAIPAGHPFSGVINDSYWSSTPEVYDAVFPTHAWTVNMDDGRVETKGMSEVLGRVAWCVRGGEF